MPHVAEWKKEEVASLKELIASHEVVGMANLLDIPAPQLQKMRRTLKDSAVLKMSRKTFMSLALNSSDKKNIEALEGYMEGQPAMIFTNMNPFKLYKILESSKTASPAKAGSIAPEDIVVPKGDTAFKPGPILGELQKIGIPAKIEKGKIVITSDKTIVAAGESIPRDVASILTRLEIFPLEVGIDLRAAYEDQTVYTSDLLTIDDEQTIPVLLQKAATLSLNLALNAEILTSKTTDLLIAKAYAQMLSLASELEAVDENAIDDELREKLSSTAVNAEVTKDNEESEEEEKEDEEEEGDAAAGLGALFG